MESKPPMGLNQKLGLIRHIEEHIYLKRGGMWFGFIFGFSFALMVWGRYVYHLQRNQMVLPWLEIVAGLLLCSFIWGLIGYLSGFMRSTGKVILIIAFTAFVTPWIVWLAKVLHENRAWFLDRRHWSFLIPLGDALESRLFFIGLWGIVIGVFSAILLRWLIPYAWDFTNSYGRTTIKSIGVFMLCLPLTFLHSSITYDMLHQDFQDTFTSLHEGFMMMDPDNPERPFLTWSMGKIELEKNPTWKWPSGEFIIDLVDYDANTMDKYFFDLIYDDGTSVRCQGGSGSMQFCGNVSSTYQQLMGIFIQSVKNHRYEHLQCEGCDPYLSTDIILALDALESDFTDNYEVRKIAQYGGSISMKARFDSGYELICRFRGEDPIVVDSCTGEYAD